MLEIMKVRRFAVKLLIKYVSNNAQKGHSKITFIELVNLASKCLRAVSFALMKSVHNVYQTIIRFQLRTTGVWKNAQSIIF